MNTKTKILKLKTSTAFRLYKEATPELKAILEENYGIDFFKQKTADIISNIDDILDVLGTTRDKVVPWKNAIDKNQRSQNALALLQCITEVYNNGRILNWKNQNQNKYINYFIYDTSGFRFFTASTHGYYALGGSSFYFYSKEDALDAATKFIDIYKDLLPE